MVNTKVKTQKIYCLEMDEKTAEILYTIMCHIGGNPSTTYRKYSDEIMTCLEDAFRAHLPAAQLEDFLDGITLDNEMFTGSLNANNLPKETQDVLSDE